MQLEQHVSLKGWKLIVNNIHHRLNVQQIVKEFVTRNSRRILFFEK